MMKDKKITISATIFAGIERVWDCYTSPEHIVNWNFADDTWHCPAATNDVRIGGRYKARMEAKDGSFGFDFEAVYHEISTHEKLVYIMTDGREVIVNFIPGDQKTEITIIFDAEEQNPEELQREGWQAILNNFKKYTEAN